MQPAPLHLAFGSKAWEQIMTELTGRVEGYRRLKDISFSTDVTE